VAHALLLSTAVLALLNAATAAINFVLNVNMVTASFGASEFNSQVARVNALTRLTLGVPEFLGMGLAISWGIYPLYSRLHSELADVGVRRDFWDLVEAQGKRRRALRRIPYSVCAPECVEGVLRSPHPTSRIDRLPGPQGGRPRASVPRTVAHLVVLDGYARSRKTRWCDNEQNRPQATIPPPCLGPDSGVGTLALPRSAFTSVPPPNLLPAFTNL
jgi:hypothetical protein